MQIVNTMKTLNLCKNNLSFITFAIGNENDSVLLEIPDDIRSLADFRINGMNFYIPIMAVKSPNSTRNVIACTIRLYKHDNKITVYPISTIELPAKEINATVSNHFMVVCPNYTEQLHEIYRKYVYINSKGSSINLLNYLQRTVERTTRSGIFLLKNRTFTYTEG